MNVWFNFKIIWLLSVPDEGYFRNASCELNFISTFLFDLYARNKKALYFGPIARYLEGGKIWNYCDIALGFPCRKGLRFVSAPIYLIGLSVILYAHWCPKRFPTCISNGAGTIIVLTPVCSGVRLSILNFVCSVLPIILCLFLPFCFAITLFPTSQYPLCKTFLMVQMCMIFWYPQIQSNLCIVEQPFMSSCPLYTG